MRSLLFYESAHETDSRDSAPCAHIYVAPPHDLIRLRPQYSNVWLHLLTLDTRLHPLI